MSPPIWIVTVFFIGGFYQSKIHDLQLLQCLSPAAQLGPAGLVGYVLCFVVATLMMIPTGAVG